MDPDNTNLTLQILSFDTHAHLGLLVPLAEALFGTVAGAALMWTDLDGRRRSASLKAIDPMIRAEPANGAGAVPSPDETLRFNAARMISRSRHVSASLNALGDIVIDVHIALTPASIF